MESSASDTSRRSADYNNTFGTRYTTDGITDCEENAAEEQTGATAEDVCEFAAKWLNNC